VRIGATNVLIFAATVAAADDRATVVVVVGAVVVTVVVVVGAVVVTVVVVVGAVVVTVVVVVGAVVVTVVVVAVVEFDEPFDASFDDPPPAVFFHLRFFPAPTHTNTIDLTLRMTPTLEHRVPAMFGVAACVAEPTATRASTVAAARQQIRRLVVVPILLAT
jgi:hypothetical protein